MIGFMSTTAFLSMWISNTATTAMMMPIADAVLKHLKAAAEPAEDAQPQDASDQSHTPTDAPINSTDPGTREPSLDVTPATLA